jgi:uncharacterized protein (DUF433 family)
MGPGILVRVDSAGDDAVVGGGRVKVSDVMRRLGAGEAADAVAADLGLEPADLVAAVAFDALGPGGGGPALVQGTPRRAGLREALDDRALAGLFPEASRPSRLGLVAGLLQVHDFWDASHRAAQDADDQGESSVSAYWHGIAHRREPDPGNASYWFRRVGRHPLFAALADAVQPTLQADPALAARLLPRGGWDPHAFIDVCSSPRGAGAELAREVQRVELAILLGASVPYD